MPQYLYVYHGGTTPTDPAEIEQVMAAWQSWFGNMGDAVVNGGNPVGQSMTVDKSGVTDNGGDNPASGFSIVSAADYDAACEMAKGCPMVADGSGSVEVAEIHQM